MLTSFDRLSRKAQAKARDLKRKADRQNKALEAFAFLAFNEDEDASFFDFIAPRKVSHDDA